MRLFRSRRHVSAALFAWMSAIAVARAQTGGAIREGAPVAALSDDAELARAVGLYDAGQYEDCARTFAALLDPRGSRPLRDVPILERARVYHAACLIGSGESDAADAPLRDAIRANPQMRAPDSLVFPPAVVDRFIRVRETLLQEIRAAEAARLREAEQRRQVELKRQLTEQARLRELERLAAEETILVTNRRWIAAVPFGVGQFQNGDDSLGWAFFGTEMLLSALVATGIAIELQNYARLDDPTLRKSDIVRNARIARDVWTVGLYSLGAIAGAGILEAQLSFQTEKRIVRPRSLPPALRKRQPGLRVVPSAALEPAGAVIGARFQF
jgi:hypothetical protein